MSRQLPLPLRWQQAFSFQNFVDAAQPGVVASLQRWLAAPVGTALALVGPTSSGKSHLLQACYRQWLATAPAMMLRLDQTELTPEVLAHSPTLPTCLDDVDRRSGGSEWSEALFVHYNRCHDAALPWVFSSSVWPLPTPLADLDSRLRSALVLPLQAIAPDALVQVLQRQAAGLGVQLSAEACAWLGNHVSRDPAVLVALLRRMHSASLADGKRLTLRYVQRFVATQTRAATQDP